jgi:NADPH:quinone reductase-like Zn-dependent oxidoreductase
MGYKVVAICSPHNYQLVKDYGADAVVDYHDGEACGLKVKKITDGGVTIGLDTISEGDSVKISAAGYAPSGGRLNVILEVPEHVQSYAKERNIELAETLMYTVFGKVITHSA